LAPPIPRCTGRRSEDLAPRVLVERVEAVVLLRILGEQVIEVTLGRVTALLRGPLLRHLLMLTPRPGETLGARRENSTATIRRMRGAATIGGHRGGHPLPTTPRRRPRRATTGLLVHRKVRP